MMGRWFARRSAPRAARRGLSRVRTAGFALPICLVLWALVGCEKERVAPIPRITVPTGRTLRIATFPSYVQPTALEWFTRQTGNRVTAETYGTNEELRRKLEAGEAYDLIFPSSYLVERLVQQDKIRPIERERVTNAVYLAQNLRNPSFDPGLAHCVPYIWSMVGIGTVANRVPLLGDPESLNDLLSPKGPKVVMIDDMRATLGATLRALGYSSNSQDVREIALARDALLAQIPRVHSYTEDPAAVLAGGEAALALAWSSEILDLRRKNLDYRFRPPREGTLLYIEYMCVPKNAHEPDAGFALMNHLLDPYTSAELTNRTMIPTTIVESKKLLEPEPRWMWSLFDGVMSRSHHYELVRDVGAAESAYRDAWQVVKQALAKAGVPTTAATTAQKK